MLLKFNFSLFIVTLLSLINPTISFSEGLFGHELYENANDFLKSEYINKNKVKDVETIDKYYKIFIEKESIKDPIDFIQYYLFIIDDFYKIHHISGKRIFQNNDDCLKIQNSISNLFEKHFVIKFKRNKLNFNKTEAFRRYGFIEGNLFMIQCDNIKDHPTLKSVLNIYLESKEYSNSVNKFWKKKNIEDKLNRSE